MSVLKKMTKKIGRRYGRIKSDDDSPGKRAKPKRRRAAEIGIDQIQSGVAS